jgi:hypothetical protein
MSFQFPKKNIVIIYNKPIYQKIKKTSTNNLSSVEVSFCVSPEGSLDTMSISPVKRKFPEENEI